MAQFLDGTGISSALTDLIKNSEKEIFLVSPYIKLTSISKKYIQSTEGKNIDIHFVHRSDAPLKSEDQSFLKQLKNVKIYSCDDLHAKCYLNENFGVISTMNMHEHSQTYNWEMGVGFSKKEDSTLYRETLKEIMRILEASGSKSSNTAKKTYQATKPQKISPKLKNPPKKGLLGKALDSVFGEMGYCIRCEEVIDYDVEKPYCDKCFASWSRYKNGNYREKHCHMCGIECSSTKIRPMCNDCYDHHFR